MMNVLSIPQDELIRKLQSGELIVMTRENAETLKQKLSIVERLESALNESGDGFLKQSPQGARINLGSGQRPFPKPWVNVDVQSKWNPDICCDAADLDKHFPDNSIEFICLHHVLEHFGCGEADGILKMCYRLLRPGGSLIVCVPDMRTLAEAWLYTQWDKQTIVGGSCERFLPPMDTQLFITNVYGAYLGDEADRHKWGFDGEALNKTLAACGDWEELKPFDWRDVGGDIARDWWVLAVEAVK